VRMAPDGDVISRRFLTHTAAARYARGAQSTRCLCLILLCWATVHQRAADSSAVARGKSACAETRKRALIQSTRTYY